MALIKTLSNMFLHTTLSNLIREHLPKNDPPKPNKREKISDVPRGLPSGTQRRPGPL